MDVEKKKNERKMDENVAVNQRVATAEFSRGCNELLSLVVIETIYENRG